MTKDIEKKQSGKLLHKIAGRLGVIKSGGGFRDLKKLNLQQLEFINHRLTKSCHLSACPGSGKTEVVGIKAAYEFASWTDDFSGIAILTFTRSAAAEIRERVLKYGGIKATQHPHFIGTFDSWLHAYLFQPFAHSLVGFPGRDGDKKIGIIENESHADFLNAFQTPPLGDVKPRPITANSFSYKPDGLPETSIEPLATIVNNPQYRSLLLQCKRKFWKGGFATYQDAEFLSYELLKAKPRITKLLSCRFPFIIIDECQDLSPAQLELLDQLCMNGTNIHFVGDLDQAIYEFRHVEPALVTAFSKKHGFIQRRLTHNYRSNQQIVNCCQHFVNGTGEIKGMEQARFSPCCILLEYADTKINELPDDFRKMIDRLHLDPNRCAILARGKTTISKINPQDDKARSPVESFAAALCCFCSPGLKTEDLNVALDQLGRCICNLAYKGKGNHQKQYCPEGKEAIDWRIFLWELLKDASSLLPFKEGEKELTWSQWARKLKSFLELRWNLIESSTDEWNSAKNKIKAPRGKVDSTVFESVNLVNQIAKVRTATIHNAKGETLEAVMLVSAPDKKSKGGHFAHWLDNGNQNKEHRRFAYVACSRARHLLIVAAKTMAPEEKTGLNGIGFISVPNLQTGVHPIEQDQPESRTTPAKQQEVIHNKSASQ
jgi:DNA helicase-2/ATP-dependent DNA helicase PcrA